MELDQFLRYLMGFLVVSAGTALGGFCYQKRVSSRSEPPRSPTGRVDAGKGISKPKVWVMKWEWHHSMLACVAILSVLGIAGYFRWEIVWRRERDADRELEVWKMVEQRDQLNRKLSHEAQWQGAKLSRMQPK